MVKGMKKALCLLLPALLGCLWACSGDPAPAGSQGGESPVKEPPGLTVSSGENSVEAGLGTYSWSFEDENGQGQGVASDSAHPLEWEDGQLPVLEGSGTAELAWDGPAPDSVSVRRWPESDRGNPDAPGEEVPLEGEGVALEEGGWVYAVYAEWDSRESWGGKAQYALLVRG